MPNLRPSLLKTLLAFSLLLGCSPWLSGQLDSLLNVLDTELDKREEYLRDKEAALAALDRERLAATTSEAKFAVTLRKVAALESFSFTRANAEVDQLYALANELNDEHKRDLARLRRSFVFLSAGLFNEAIDTLSTINLHHFSKQVRAEYYATRARCYIDLSDNYPSPKLAEEARSLAVSNLDSALTYVAVDTIERLSLEAFRAIARRAPREGIQVFHQVRQHPQATVRLMAKEYGTVGVNYNALNLTDSARLAIVHSAIADERTVTREAISLVRVARYAYEIGDYERSARYIRIGLENANFFDARHRKIEVLGILPLIEQERQELLRAQRTQFIVFTSLLSLLLLLAIWLIRRAIRQNKELQKRRKSLQDAFQQLRENNQALRESQRIKEQYIGYFFQTNTKLITAARKVIDKAAKAVYAADFKEAKFQLKSFNAKQQHQQLLQDFDQAFLTLFPGFVSDFQHLFPHEESWQGTDTDELTTEVRIFALMRLGIKNNDTIAKILGYSVNTIYAYRSKVKGKSTLDKDDFDRAVMAISSTATPAETT
jgi:predicted negative regulator of RcsB-dependent stress response